MITGLLKKNAHKFWLLTAIVITTAVSMCFFVHRYMDEYMHFHLLAYEKSNFKYTEFTFLGFNDPMLLLFGSYSYKMSFFYVGKASSLLFYPFFKIFPLNLALSFYNIVSFAILCFLLKYACNWNKWQVLIFAFAYPVLVSFMHDGGPLKIASLAFPLSALAFKYLFDDTTKSKYVISILIGLFWCMALEDKIFFLFLLPSILFFALSSVNETNINWSSFKRNYKYLVIPFLIFLVFSAILLSATFYSPNCFWKIEPGLTYFKALQKFNGNPESGTPKLLSTVAYNFYTAIIKGDFARFFYYFLYSSRLYEIPIRFSSVAKVLASSSFIIFAGAAFIAIFKAVVTTVTKKKLQHIPIIFILLSIILFLACLSVKDVYRYLGHHIFFFWIIFFQFLHLMKSNISFKPINYFYIFLFFKSSFFYGLLFFSKPAYNTTAMHREHKLNLMLDSINSNNKYAINFSSFHYNNYCERSLEKSNELITFSGQSDELIPLSLALFLKKNNLKLLEVTTSKARKKLLPLTAQRKLLQTIPGNPAVLFYEYEFIE